jgi:hypothetical protein
MKGIDERSFYLHLNFMKKFLVVFILCLSFIISTVAQEEIFPLEINKYQKVTSYNELSSFVSILSKNSDLLKVEVIGQSVKGRSIYALKFSKTEFGKDKRKIKVLFFAQQHGNEQSGKEGALLLAAELLKPENRYLFDQIDFAIVPQMNPDGSELNKRQNGNNVDLNRNHLILSEPETMALNHFFDQYLFEVNMDVHEYSPFGKDWKKYGYRKNFDVTIGGTTNPNVSKPIREISNTEILPFVLKLLDDKKFSAFEYCLGGPPEFDYMRQSTFDISDGRQSLGIQNSFSFIQEGMNGTDMYLENLKHRAEGQMTGMLGMLKYVYNHHKQIKNTVRIEREKLVSGKANRTISIQTEHVKNGQKLYIPLYSYHSKTDTLVSVNDYRPEAETITDVHKPLGYLIPKKQEELIEWLGRQVLVSSEYRPSRRHRIEQYSIEAIDSLDFERIMIVNPEVRIKQFQGKITSSDYIYIPTAQLKGNLIVLALEPKSMLGLVTYPQFADLLKVGEAFPILRVSKK